MRTPAVILSTIVLAASLVPMVAFAAADDVQIGVMKVRVARDKDGAPMPATIFDPQFKITGEDVKHVTFRWVVRLSCGRGTPGDFLVPGDKDTPTTFTWGHASCTGTLTAGVQVLAYFDGAPFAQCSYLGGPADGEEGECTRVDPTVTEHVQLTPGDSLVKDANSPDAGEPSAPESPRGGIGDIPLAVIGGSVLVLAILAVDDARKRAAAKLKK